MAGSAPERPTRPTSIPEHLPTGEQYWLVTAIHTGHRRADPSVFRIACATDSSEIERQAVELMACQCKQYASFWFERIALTDTDDVLLVGVERIDGFVGIQL